MDENRFWSIIDTAWKSTPRLTKLRESMLKTLTAPETREHVQPYIPDEEEWISAIEQQLDRLSSDELLRFDRIIEQKLYQIDREELHEYTDGSDDGFLYCRGFIVALGKAYYDAINARPALAMMDCECESITYLSLHLYEKKFGDLPASGISRESQSNQAGW